MKNENIKIYTMSQTLKSIGDDLKSLSSGKTEHGCSSKSIQRFSKKLSKLQVKLLFLRSQLCGPEKRTLLTQMHHLYLASIQLEREIGSFSPPRQGRHYWPHIELKYTKSDTEISKKIAHEIAAWIRKHKPDHVFIDTGEGWGVIDELHSLGYRQLVTPVNFGETRTLSEKDKATYANARSQMWCRLADHISGEEGPVNLPDSNDVQKDLMSMPEAFRE